MPHRYVMKSVWAIPALIDVKGKIGGFFIRMRRDRMLLGNKRFRK